MSNKKKSGTPFTPTAAPTEPQLENSSANPAQAQASLTPAELQEWNRVLQKIDDNKWIARAVLAAGIASVLEIIHLCWLAGKFMYYFRPQ